MAFRLTEAGPSAVMLSSLFGWRGLNYWFANKYTSRFHKQEEFWAWTRFFVVEFLKPLMWGSTCYCCFCNSVSDYSWSQLVLDVTKIHWWRLGSVMWILYYIRVLNRRKSQELEVWSPYPYSGDGLWHCPSSGNFSWWPHLHFLICILFKKKYLIRPFCWIATFLFLAIMLFSLYVVCLTSMIFIYVVVVWSVS